MEYINSLVGVLAIEDVLSETDESVDEPGVEGGWPVPDSEYVVLLVGHDIWGAVVSLSNHGSACVLQDE